MKSKLFWSRLIGLALIIFTVTVFVAPEIAEARRGGSFGGSRRGGGFGSFGGSRKSAPAPRRTNPGSGQTFGGSRRSSTPSAAPRRVTTFGGTRMTTQTARAKYGTPRRVETMRAPGVNGYQNYNVHHYGGFGSGLMTGYIMGQIPWYWSMPFHPAFYYSRPNYVQNANGGIDVYPPTFSFAKLFFGLIVLAAILFVLWRIYKSVKNRKQLMSRGGSFG